MEQNQNQNAVSLFVRERNEEAFRNFYYLYFPRLLRFAEKIIKDADLAKDVVQNIFIKIWENPQCLPVEAYEAFLYKMVRNASLNYIRHLKVIDSLKSEVKNQYLGEELYHIDLVGDQPCILIEQELHQKVVEVLDSLPEKCRQVFKLSRIDGLKNKEIAEKLQISLKSVEKHISKALAVYKHSFSDILPLQIFLLILGEMK